MIESTRQAEGMMASLNIFTATDTLSAVVEATVMSITQKSDVVRKKTTQKMTLKNHQSWFCVGVIS